MLRTPIYLTRYIAPLIAAATTAVALAACGGSGHRSATAEVEHTITAYRAALAAGDGGAACALVTTELRRDFARANRSRDRTATCAAYVHDVPADLYGVAPGERLAIPAVAVHGTRATATIRLPDRTSGTARRFEDVKVPLTASNGRWLMTSDQPIR